MMLIFGTIAYTSYLLVVGSDVKPLHLFKKKKNQRNVNNCCWFYVVKVKKKELSLTYTTRVTTALLRPLNSKSMNVKLMAIGLLSPCSISILFIRNGSNGGMANPLCPFGWF